MSFTRRGVRYDLVFDVPGTRPFSEMKRALEPDGRYLPIGHEGFGAERRRVFGLVPKFLTLMALSRFVPQLRGPALPMPGKQEAIAALREYLETRKVTPVIDSRYPLAEVREAFRHFMRDETLGKVVLVC